MCDKCLLCVIHALLDQFSESWELFGAFNNNISEFCFKQQNQKNFGFWLQDIFIMKRTLMNCFACFLMYTLFMLLFFYFGFSLTSLSRLFHSYEPIGRWGETGVPRENHLTHPYAELGLSHMWPVRGSNLHQTQR